MADFYQTGVVTTLHRLKPNSIERLELDLERFARTRPIGLVLPALYSEFETPAMQTIVPELQDMISRYYADAMLNGLKFDRHAEEMAVAAFAESLKRAASEFMAEPRGHPLIPNWNRVLAAIPEFFEVLRDAVEKDNKEN